MPSSNLPPEEQTKVKPFDPLVLDRTVIAVPLLREMQEDLDLIAKVQKAYPKAAQEFNSVIEFNKNFRGGAKAAREKVLTMAEDAAKDAKQAVQAARESRKSGLTTATKETLETAQKRDDALLEAIKGQTIGPLQPKSAYSFALLHAAIIRRLLAANERLASPEKPDVQPIQRIHPKRFEILIDLNLEYPGGREAARQWVLNNIENAKKQADVLDAGQGIHLEKDRRNSQYLFARLEARAIQRLVALDMEAAKIAAEEIAAKKAAAEKEAAVTTASQDNATAKTAAESPKLTAISSKPPDPSKCRAIFHIWPDFEISACINKSIATVKADAAQNSFSALGAGITWAVMDSGIDATHPHFRKHANVNPASDWHKDFTVDRKWTFRRQERPRHACRGYYRWRMARAAGRAEGDSAAACSVALFEGGHRGRRIPRDPARWYQRDGAAMQAC